MSCTSYDSRLQKPCRRNLVRGNDNRNLRDVQTRTALEIREEWNHVKDIIVSN